MLKLNSIIFYAQNIQGNKEHVVYEYFGVQRFTLKLEIMKIRRNNKKHLMRGNVKRGRKVKCFYYVFNPEIKLRMHSNFYVYCSKCYRKHLSQT